MIKSTFFLTLFILATTKTIDTAITSKRAALPFSFSYIQDIDPTIIVDARYSTSDNFIGSIVDGYLRNTAICTEVAAIALSNVQADLKPFGYSLVIYDAYRPQKAVDHFLRWINEPEDSKTKNQFYPYISKADIITLGYLAPKSGHTRGSTVDLSIIPIGKKLHDVVVREVILRDGTKTWYRDDGSQFMGSSFDLSHEVSHHNTPLIEEEETTKRNLLRSLMEKHGFLPLAEEWWHYRLIAEPYPNMYFNFDVV